MLEFVALQACWLPDAQSRIPHPITSHFSLVLPIRFCLGILPFLFKSISTKGGAVVEDDVIVTNPPVSLANIPGVSHGNAMVKGNNVVWHFALQKEVYVCVWGRGFGGRGKIGRKNSGDFVTYFSPGSGG